jgi:uncharacterized membrane protein
MQPTTPRRTTDRDTAGGAVDSPAAASRAPRRLFAWRASPRIFILRMLVYVLFVAAGTCFCVALLVLMVAAGIWLGLHERAGIELAGEIAACGVVAVGLGFAVFVVLDRALARQSRDDADADSESHRK